MPYSLPGTTVHELDEACEKLLAQQFACCIDFGCEEVRRGRWGWGVLACIYLASCLHAQALLSPAAPPPHHTHTHTLSARSSVDRAGCPINHPSSKHRRPVNTPSSRAPASLRPASPSTLTSGPPAPLAHLLQALPAILKWGLASEGADGRLSAAPLPEALRRLDSVWDSLHDFKVRRCTVGKGLLPRSSYWLPCCLSAWRLRARCRGGRAPAAPACEAAALRAPRRLARRALSGAPRRARLTRPQPSATPRRRRVPRQAPPWAAPCRPPAARSARRRQRRPPRAAPRASTAEGCAACSAASAGP